MDKKEDQQEDLTKVKATSNRPSTLALNQTTAATTTTTTADIYQFYNIDNISLTPSPLPNQPITFQKWSVIDRATYERVYASVYGHPPIPTPEQEKFEKNMVLLMEAEAQQEEKQEKDDNENGGQSLNEEPFDENILTQTRNHEIERLSQVIVESQPINDEIAATIIEQLDLVIDAAVPVDSIVLDSVERLSTQEEVPLISSMIATHPYPPIYQEGIVSDHDRPYADYGHLSQDFIEFGSFKSTTRQTQITWPTQTTPCPLSSSSSSPPPPPAPVPPPPTTTTTLKHDDQTTNLRQQANNRRQEKIAIAKHAIELARTSVDSAMDYILKMKPNEFLTHSTWYLSSFNYIHLRQQQRYDQNDPNTKEYVWPHSFPDCTPALRDAMNYWLTNHFVRRNGAKCLILIGPTSVGKTAFALSLPGRVNYFLGRWHLDEWSDYARYSVFDEIPWDDFDKLNFPNKKGLLLQKGRLKATDKYRGTTTINVTQPAIVLLHEYTDVGSLATRPTTIPGCAEANFWNKRALIYRMGTVELKIIPCQGEYFCKPPNRRQTDSDEDSSVRSLIGSQEARIGEPNEFEQTTRQWNSNHQAIERIAMHEISKLLDVVDDVKKLRISWY
ncbi:unnamed protein product [Rotaria sordida]|uniref:Uncharacterized protein n=1 Tax=Rotaria sordida TaxID=392033 RepID=A0A815ZD92_9BILA|nr:unnamed protein product [Rotaria sordida]CAF1581295.1 unnamed protein product [Rotaria sordida]